MKGKRMPEEYERFDAFARRVVRYAEEEARLSGNNFISTEHILLGLLRVEGSVASKVLRQNFDLTVELVRAQVYAYMGEGQGTTLGHLSFTSWAREVFEWALLETELQGREYVTTDTILVGLFRDKTGLAAPILHDFDAEEQAIRRAIDEELGRIRRPYVSAGSN